MGRASYWRRSCDPFCNTRLHRLRASELWSLCSIYRGATCRKISLVASNASASRAMRSYSSASFNSDSRCCALRDWIAKSRISPASPQNRLVSSNLSDISNYSEKKPGGRSGRTGQPVSLALRSAIEETVAVGWSVDGSTRLPDQRLS
jgi:hypothetical protein